jgi:hypothetical protein
LLHKRVGKYTIYQSNEKCLVRGATTSERRLIMTFLQKLEWRVKVTRSMLEPQNNQDHVSEPNQEQPGRLKYYNESQS